MTCQQETQYSQQGYQSRTLVVKTCDAKPAVRRETLHSTAGHGDPRLPLPCRTSRVPGPDLGMLATNITQTTMGWRQKSLPEVKPEDSPVRGDGTAALLNLWTQGHSTMGDQGNQPTGHKTAALRGMWVNPPTSQLTQQRGDQGKATAHERTDRQRAGKQEKRRGHRSALGKALRNSPGFIPTAQETPVTMVGKGSGDISTDPTEVERTIGESHEC